MTTMLEAEPERFVTLSVRMKESLYIAVKKEAERRDQSMASLARRQLRAAARLDAYDA